MLVKPSANAAHRKILIYGVAFFIAFFFTLLSYITCRHHFLLPLLLQTLPHLHSPQDSFLLHFLPEERRTTNQTWHNKFLKDEAPYPHIKARLGKPVGGKRSQNQAKESETGPASTVRSTSRTSSYTTIIYILSLPFTQFG